MFVRRDFQRIAAGCLILIFFIQSGGIFLCLSLPIWSHRVVMQRTIVQANRATALSTVGSMSLPDADAELMADASKVACAKACAEACDEEQVLTLHRPQSPADFEQRNGHTFFKGKPLQIIAIPRQLEEEPTGDFQRIHKKEFRYLGQMYDVVLSRAGRDTTWYTVFADHKEDELLAARDQAAGWQNLKDDSSEPAIPGNSRHLLSRLPGPALLPGIPVTWTPPSIWAQALARNNPASGQAPGPPVPPPREKG